MSLQAKVHPQTYWIRVFSLLEKSKSPVTVPVDGRQVQAILEFERVFEIVSAD